MGVAPVVLAAVLAQTTLVAPGSAPLAPAGSRLLRLERAEDGAPVVYRNGDPTPVRGVDIYRAVVRLDLVDEYEHRATLRRAAWVAAALAAVAGPALGYAFGKAAAEPLTNCSISIDGVLIPECRPNPAIEAANDQRVRHDVLVGAAIGAGVSAVFVVAALAIHPHAPSYDEASDLVGRWNARLGSARSGAAREPRVVVSPRAGGAALSLALRW
jgi:hypothetical protein